MRTVNWLTWDNVLDNDIVYVVFDNGTAARCVTFPDPGGILGANAFISMENEEGVLRSLGMHSIEEIKVGDEFLALKPTFGIVRYPVVTAIEIYGGDY